MGGGFQPAGFYNTGTILGPANHGELLLRIGCGFTSEAGTLEAETNSMLAIQPINYGWVYFQNGSVFNGPGVVRFPPSNGSVGWDGMMLVNGTVELDGPLAMGSPTWTGPGLFRWLSGGMGSFTFNPGFQVQILGTGEKVIEGVCLNQGVIRWVDESDLTTLSSATFMNRGRFEVESDGNWNSSIVFSNEAGGTFRQTAGQFALGTLNNSGSSVELAKGILNLTTLFSSDASSDYHLALGGYAPGTDFGLLNADYLAPGGSLSVTFTNGFAPTNGASFVIATASVCEGRFAATTLPALSSNQTWRVRYAPESITLEVVAPTRLGNATRLPDGTFQFTLTGATGSGYVVEVSTNMLHWYTIESNGPFNGTLIFTDTNAPGFGRRFYRTQIVE
jgi:hypothetical protein